MESKEQDEGNSGETTNCVAQLGPDLGTALKLPDTGSIVQEQEYSSANDEPEWHLGAPPCKHTACGPKGHKTADKCADKSCNN